MSTKRWVCGLAAAVVMTIGAAHEARAQAPDPEWRALTGRAVVVERQDGSLVAGKLVRVDEASVEVETPGGGPAVVERAAVKAVRRKLRDQQVIVTMIEKDETIAGKLAESDAKTIVVETDDGRRVTLERALVKTVRERFPDAPPAAPPPPVYTPAYVSPSYPSEPPPAWGERAADGVRARIGLGGGGGTYLVTVSSGPAGGAFATAPALALSLRLGIQVNHYFSLYYQNTPVLAIPTDGSGVLFCDANALLAGLTLAHHFDLGAGPSVDVLEVSGSSSASAVLPGMHARFAYVLSSRGREPGDGPRRRGVSIGIELHPTFGHDGLLMYLGAGLGYEWY